MSVLAETLRRALARLHRRAGAPAGPRAAEIEELLDSRCAAAAVEACLAEAVAVDAGFPGSDCAAPLRDQMGADGVNLFGRATSCSLQPDGRSALAAARGMALAGARTAAFVDGPGLCTSLDELAELAAQHVPLVIHLDCRALGAAGRTRGGGHEAYHAAADAGAVLLLAGSVQDTVDLSLLARRTAESCLLPVIVASDTTSSGRALQLAKLPSAELALRMIGAPEQQVAPASAAQRLLYGGTRPRVVRWFDLERPLLIGADRDAIGHGLAAVGDALFFAEQAKPALSDARRLLAELTGRACGALIEHRVDDARQLIVAQGATVDIAVIVADALRRDERRKVGVIGLRQLRPFPAARLAELARGRQSLLVLERAPATLASEPPLSREIRAALARGVECSRHRNGVQPDYPKLAARDLPLVRSALYEMGGYPLRAGDLAQCVRSAEQLSAEPVYLGVDLDSRCAGYPRRQAVLDQLARDYPKLARRGLRGPALGGAADGEQQARAAVYRRAGAGTEGVISLAARLLQGAAGGELRAVEGGGWDAWEALEVDRLCRARSGTPAPADSGDEVHVAVVTREALAPSVVDRAAASLCPGGVLLVELGDPSLLAHRLTERARETLRERSAQLALCAPLPDEAAACRIERLAGALIGALDGNDRVAIQLRKLRVARKRDLETTAGEAAAGGDEQRVDDEITALVAALIAGFSQLRRLPAVDWPEASASEASGPRDAAIDDERVPAALRSTGDAPGPDGLRVDSVPAFHAAVGAAWEAGDQSALGPDPLLAAGSVPPLTAGFRRLQAGELLPQIDIGACTACGRCWSGCPEGAFGAAALSPRALLEGGLAAVKRDGGDAGALQPMLANVGSRAARVLRDAEAGERPQTAGELLRAAFDAVLAKAGFAEQRQQAMEAAFSAVEQAIGALPLVCSETLFERPEAAQRGSGELLVLVADPDACKSCGICAAVCEPGAIELVARSDQRSEAMRGAWRLWERAPDTAGATIARLRQSSELDELAALQLSRHCSRALAPGDGAEPGSGAKIALRAVLATGEHVLQRRALRQLERVESLEERLAKRTRELLVAAFPAGDVEALARSMEQLDDASVGLGELVERIEGVAERRKVDAGHLQQLVDSARELGELRWQLSRGVHGLGRGRLSLLLDGDELLRGVATFPRNPFQVPVVVAGGERAAPLAQGLVEGQVRQALAGLRALRRAEMVLENPTAAALAQPRLARLTYDELTEEERALCPPLLLVGRTLSRGALEVLLGTNLPLKVVLFGDGGAGLARGAGEEPLHSDLGVLGLARRRALVAQLSIGAPSHLVRGITAALEHDGPALLHVHAPSPQLHGFAPRETLARAERAVASRVFPLFVLDPAAEGVFGGRLDLSGNPGAQSRLADDGGGLSLTPLDWILGERRFAGCFRPLDGDPAPLELSEYFELESPQRDKHTPYLAGNGGGSKAGPGQRLVPSGQALAFADQRLRAWRTLQELAGVVTPFTDRVRAEAEREVRDEHDEEIATLRQQHGRQLSELEQQHTAQMAERVRQRLLALAGYPATRKELAS